MLVDVVRMRSNGLKLSAEAIAGMTVIRGDLSISTTMWADPHDVTLPKAMTTFASLADPEHAGAVPLLPILVRAHVNNLRGDNLVVIGQETVPERPGDYQPQAWLCTLVTDQDEHPTPAAPPRGPRETQPAAG